MTVTAAMTAIAALRFLMAAQECGSQWAPAQRPSMLALFATATQATCTLIGITLSRWTMTLTTVHVAVKDTGLKSHAKNLFTQSMQLMERLLTWMT